MIRFTLSAAVQLLRSAGYAAEVRDNSQGETSFHGLSTDSRTLQVGQIFIALTGPNFDGHDFAQAALEQGASAILCQRWLAAAVPQLRVTDTLSALGCLSAAWRAQFTLPVLALTGSNGKTTVKEMLAAILRQRGQVLATEGNLNNQIGLPLMLARLAVKHDFAVFEMGANHAGEIAYLTALARPDVALINNAGPAHLEGFGDLDGVARAKGEIYQGLPSSGIALINADDHYADYWRGLNASRRMIDFGFARHTQVRGEVLPDQGLRIWLEGQSTDVALALPGEHNQRNALAAAAAAWAVGLDSTLIRTGLETMQPVQGRLQTLTGVHGCTLINDTYNANPASLLAGLRALPVLSERWLVLGDMAELGATTEALHAQLGRDIRAAGIRRLFTLGELSHHTSQAFGAGSAHFTAFSQLAAAVRAALAEQQQAPPVVLVKGSRSMRMERLVDVLQASEREPRESAPC